MQLGGPVWHVSVAGRQPVMARRIIALNQLVGVGARRLGEWWEVTEMAVHLRRRLSSAEQELVGNVVDIRGTPEAVLRISRVPARFLRMIPPDMLRAEWGGEVLP